MKMDVGMKVIGHELVTEKDMDGNEYDMLKIKLRGLDDKKTKCEILTVPDRGADFPLGDQGELRFEIRQTRMDLGEAQPAKARGAAKH